MKKSLITIAALIILVGGGYYFYQGNLAKAPTGEIAPNTNNQNQDQQQNTQSPAPSPSPAASENTPNPAPTPPPSGIFSDGEETDGPDIQVVEIAYDGKAYSPSTVSIKVNDYVIFKNNSDTDFWPASAPHPSHTNYPEFDAKKPIAPGGKFQFQFTQEGAWSFHDHLNPSAFGKITVTK